MAQENVQRRLAAILAADVVGYSRLMEQDEAGVLTALKSRRKEVLEPLVARHRGRVFKIAGDGVLVEFASAVHAVQCAIDLQRGMNAANNELPAHRCIVLRIGVNLGDVIVEGSDLYGDGVNIAARLEGIADPGGILISGSAYDQVKNKIDTEFEDLGSQSLKNIGEMVRIYQPRPGSQIAEVRPALTLPEKPSIAVLPFVNMSTDPEHEFFADGLSEDLITDLSQVPGLFVIARNSSFAYKGKSVDVRSIARNLGVRYVLEGSARRAAGRVRINAQLIDAIGGGHLWAERFDRRLDDVFDVQDEVRAKIVDALAGRLRAAQIPERKRPTNLEAYDLCVRVRASIGQTLNAQKEAHVLLRRAIELDPGYAECHRWLAMNIWAEWRNSEDSQGADLHTALATAERAVALDPNDAGNRWMLGYLLAVARRWQESDEQFAAAFNLDPNNADAWAIYSDLSVLSGRPKEAIDQIERALRLNPRPVWWYWWMLGQAQYAARQYDKAEKTLRREETFRTVSRRTLAATLARLGRLDEAHEESKLFMIANPRFTIRHWVVTQAVRDQAALEHFVEGYRQAGLPE
jgi:TolB-like protein/predicted Zn-dependent protease